MRRNPLSNLNTSFYLLAQLLPFDGVGGFEPANVREEEVEG
jgi:hypothetical protein